MKWLVGSRIRLRPLMLDERRLFFQWATHSDATPYWYGPLYGDDVPSFEVFKLEWSTYYFTEDSPHRGRCFGIVLDDRLIGQVNYNEINHKDYSVSLDILIGSKKDQNKGYGTEAIMLLTRYLFETFDIRKCQIEVISRNPRAYKAYENAGYHHVYTYVRQTIVWHVMECMKKAVPVPLRVISAPDSKKGVPFSPGYIQTNEEKPAPG